MKPFLSACGFCPLTLYLKERTFPYMPWQLLLFVTLIYNRHVVFHHNSVFSNTVDNFIQPLLIYWRLGNVCTCEQCMFFSLQVLEWKKKTLTINLGHSVISLSHSWSCHITCIFLEMLLEIPTEFQFSLL